MRSCDCVVIGGGAAGIFAAINIKATRPDLSVIVLEKTNSLLSKVKISGGGRCNVTHHCFEPKDLVKNYPRGNKELIGPFTRFGPKETITWFQKRGVELKTEPDGRMFPTTDLSSTIISALLNEADRLGVEILRQTRIEKIEPGFCITLKNGDTLHTRALVLASGSSKEGYAYASNFGHTISAPIPSLFTFNTPSSPLLELSGIALKECALSLKFGKYRFLQKGPLLLTHWGFSGPAALKLSAWAARELAEVNYRTKLEVNWLPEERETSIFETLNVAKRDHPNKSLSALNPWQLPKKLWSALIGEDFKLNQIKEKHLRSLSQKLVRDIYHIEGKTTNKEEFVTAGGITLKEIDFKQMQSKLSPHLYFAGEIMDIDGVTGGFNFQNAWTSGAIAAAGICDNL